MERWLSPLKMPTVPPGDLTLVPSTYIWQLKTTYESSSGDPPPSSGLLGYLHISGISLQRHAHMPVFEREPRVRMVLLAWLEWNQTASYSYKKNLENLDTCVRSEGTETQLLNVSLSYRNFPRLSGTLIQAKLGFVTWALERIQY